MVFSGLVTDWRLATWPTRRLPSLANATTDGVVRPPSEFVITVGSPPSITATTELVVPKSIPIILLIFFQFSEIVDFPSASEPVPQYSQVANHHSPAPLVEC